MIERGGGSTAAHEPLPERVVAREGGIEDLQRDATSEPQMASEVHGRQGAATEDRLDLMTGELGAHPRIIGLHVRVLALGVRRG